MGWTSASGPKRSAVTWNANPAIMLAIPASQTGRRASRKSSAGSNPSGSAWPTPSRWHSEEVAVHPLAASASAIALYIAACFPASARLPSR